MSPRRDLCIILLLGARIASGQQSMAGMQMPTPSASSAPAPKASAAKKNEQTAQSSHAAPKHQPAHDAHSMHDMHDMHDMHMPPAPTPATPSSTAPALTAQPANDHVPPPAPTHLMPPMSATQMTDLMQMDDADTRGMWRFDRLERTRDDDGKLASAWETDAWWGGDIDKLWLRSEGERSGQGTRDARAELLWSHAYGTFWDWRLGVRDDFGAGPGRQWLAVGVQGLAPYWFDLGATLYAGPQGRTAARIEASYDLRFTQRLILAPELELNFYGKNDPRRDVHAGLSDAELGLRLRYEISRRFAPYVGVNWHWRPHDRSPALPPAAAAPAHERTWLLGVRCWL